MQQLSLDQVQGDGALATPQTNTSTAKRFELWAVAFFRNGDRVYPCQIEETQLRTVDGGGLECWHRVRRGGLRVWIPQRELLSGWEPGFPSWSDVCWGNFKATPPDEYPSPEELEGDRIEAFFDDWADDGLEKEQEQYAIAMAEEMEG